MPKVVLTDALREEYQALFDTCQARPGREGAIENAAASLVANRARYESVGLSLDVPWELVAVIHNMESGQRFDRHLHNGDPLGARTVHVPAGRPAGGSPPFSWEESAADALDRFEGWSDWSVPGVLYCLEGYNGWGYRNFHPEVKSPYLWSFSNHYVSGKYVADGTWSDSAVSAQIGSATLLRRIAELGQMGEDFAGREALFRFAPDRVTPDGIELQRFLNRVPGTYLREDGKLGPRTSEACRRAFGHYLDGDPRS